MVSLVELGWNARWEAELGRMTRPGRPLVAARVAAEHRGRLELWGVGSAPLEAELGGRLRHAAGRREDLPVVGDWVAARLGTGRAVVDAVLPRTSVVARRQVGKASARQPLAANVDRVVIVTAVGADFSPRRVERYLAVAWDGGARPCVVLGKADLVDDAAPYLEALEAVAAGAPVIAASAADGRGLAAIGALLGAGVTGVVLGSSGVGKSTLVNALAGAGVAPQATGVVRAADDKGRHTTTARQLVVLAGGGLVIDTPGMRELGVAGDADGVGEAFADVEALAAGCRFRDCRHRGEPGCAVADAVAEGVLDGARVAAFAALAEEAEREAARRARRRR